MFNQTKPISKDIIELSIVLLLFLALLYALYSVLSIFFGVLTFGLIFSVSFNKLYERLALLLKGRRKLAAVVYTVLLIAVIALPLIILIAALGHHVKQAIAWLGIIKNQGLPALPEWINNLPYVGSDIASFYNDLKNSPKEVLHLHEHQLKPVLEHILSGGLGIMGVALQFVLGTIISAFFLERGELVLKPIKSTVGNLLGERDGPALLQATCQAIKGVSIGVMGTSFIAAFVSWVGLVIAGIPFAIGISALIFFLVMIQAGPLIVWVPLVIWQAAMGNTGMTIFLVIYGIGIVIIDAVVKPLLIAKSGGKLPFLVLFMGVVGGLSAWGFTGMFKGAIILAVFYTIYTSWLERRTVPAPDAEVS